MYVRVNGDNEVKMMDISGFHITYHLYPGCPLVPVPPSWLFYQKSCWRNLLLPVSAPLLSSSPSSSALTWSPVGGRVKILVTWSTVERNWTQCLLLSFPHVYLHLGLLSGQSDVKDIQNLLQILMETDTSKQNKLGHRSIRSQWMGHRTICHSGLQSNIFAGWTVLQFICRSVQGLCLSA